MFEVAHKTTSVKGVLVEMAVIIM